VISGDFNNDTKLDLAVTNSLSNTVSVLLGYGNGTFQTGIDYAVGSGPSSVISGDVNNDNKLDLMVTNSDSGDLSVLLNICE
jgi:hypothetical protein